MRASPLHKIDAELSGFEPCLRIDLVDQAGIPRRHLLWLMIQELVRNGIFTLGAFILCYSHNNRDIRFLGQAFDRSMSVLR